ncbi:type II secretion system F family protein [Pseudoalteromonas sp. NZS127_1]|jgi:MSHA biogenesis protein MshG|uniref:MSHA biogenesis protein MshG n=3 Tax=Pseudoalteromonas TaxID=53246 RepID=A0A290RZ87_9GAMM|nr:MULTISPECIES: type II secretion system F family protein [Pseudoalteromonas]ATC85189.1 MSHA biogenesis protein MshG [Pseudoalteromonas arctica A 37-1-2]MBG9994766.1 type II secretion system F family protein [Pseudoalteromonas sp. NZS127_1]MBH0003223.1 type II secretion system F family protein [Pseudoalteromonas sp. SWYJZ12]MBH0011653.1 type II secretion system F family protein [Pseudoalteromonas sp. NZS100_1]MBH0035420.1 type II secretion system F family protein [Pseudoalteromonas sp. NZS71_
MQLYSYKAKDSKGVLVKGQLEASNQAGVADSLMKRQFIPISISLVETKNNIKIFDNLFVEKITLDDMIMFSRQMYSLLKAGIPIIRAMIGLADTTQNKEFKNVLMEVTRQLEQGRDLSSAMAIHNEVFSRLTVSMVMVGEGSGRLEDAFYQLAIYFEKEQETRKRIKAAMRYPTFVILALVAAMVILNIFVIPTFASMFAKFDAELPLMTQILIGTSSFFVNYWWLLLVMGIGAVFAWKRYLNTDAGRFKWDQYKLKIPFIGDILKRTLLARYSQSLAMVLRSGVPMTTGLSLTAHAVDNSYMEKAIITMRQDIEKGDSLLRASKSSELFSQLVLQMVAVGEETGRVDELLQEAADYYEREVDYDLRSLTAKIEPILTVFVAIMVLILALGIFMPMWNMMSAIKGN